MGADPVDDSVAAVTHQAAERAQLLIELLRLLGQGADQRTAARTQRVLERRQTRGERVVDAFSTDGDGSDCLRRGGSEPLAGELSDFRPAGQRLTRAFAETLVRFAALGLNGLDRAFAGRVDMAAQSARGLV